MHFENIWDQAEAFLKNTRDDDVSKSLERIKELVNKDPGPESLGSLLLEVANISRITNINVAAALLYAVEQEKVDTYE